MTEIYLLVAAIAGCVAWTVAVWVARGSYDALLHEKDTQLWEYERNDLTGENADLRRQLEAHQQIQGALVGQAERDAAAAAEPDPARARDLLYGDPPTSEPDRPGRTQDPTA